MVTTVVLKAPDISCGHCVKAIKTAVSEINGVSTVDGDTERKEVFVTYDPSVVELDAIEKVMEEEGYPVDKS